MTTATTYYVRASISADGNFADCQYFYDRAGAQPVEGSQLRVPPDASGCTIAPVAESPLVLMAASYKTFGLPPSMNTSNFCPSDDEDSVWVPMPGSKQTVTKGVVLLFAAPGAVEGIYPSSDPEISNGYDL